MYDDDDDDNEDKQWTNFDQEYHLPLKEKKENGPSWVHDLPSRSHTSYPLWIQLGYIITTITLN